MNLTRFAPASQHWFRDVRSLIYLTKVGYEASVKLIVIPKQELLYEFGKPSYAPLYY